MLLLLISSSSSFLLLSALSNNKSTIVISAIAKKKDSTLSLSHHRGTMTFNSNTNTANNIHTHSNHHFHPNKNQKILHSMNSSITMTSSSSSSPSTISLSPSSERSSDLPAPSLREQQTIVQRLYAVSAIAASNNGDPTNNDFKSQTHQQPCLDSSYVDKFILSLKESRFTHIRPCVTVTGTVISGQKINADGDISFNIAVDPPYQGMLGPGNLDPSRATSTGEHGIHIEVICQEPVISKAPMDIGACNGYNGPDFHSVLPSTHQHVMITGRFQIEWNESPGGLTEIHPVYAIKTIPTSS
jgi:hypothetical protein